MKKIIFDYKFIVEKRVHLEIDKLVDFVDENDTSLYDVIRKYINRYKCSFFTIENKYEVLNDIQNELIIDTIEFDEEDFEDEYEDFEDEDFIEYMSSEYEDYIIDFTIEDLIKLKNKV